MQTKDILELITVLAWPIVAASFFIMLIIKQEIRRFKARRANSQGGQ